MNRAFNHGSQGDFFTGAAAMDEGVTTTLSSAPSGTGQMIRNAARDGNETALRELLKKWKSDPVINEVQLSNTTTL